MTTYRKPAVALQLPILKDHMIQLMIQHVSLNRFDQKFLTNISERYIVTNKPLSEGQNELFDKLAHKYRKQLKRLHLNYEEVIALKWSQKVLSQADLKKKSLLTIEDGVMLLQMKFDKKMIDDVRSLLYDDNKEYINKLDLANDGFLTDNGGDRYDFAWHKDEKIWRGPFAIYLFRNLIRFANRNNIEIGEPAQKIYDTMMAAGKKDIWTPHLHIVNDRMYISQIAESMLPLIEDIDFTDMSIDNVERITRLGVAAPSQYDMIAEYVNGSSVNFKHVVKEPTDVVRLKSYIKSSSRKFIFYYPTTPTTPNSSWIDDEIAVLDNVELVREYGKEKFDFLINTGYNTLITLRTINYMLNAQNKVGSFALTADKVIYIEI
jgi:hypothetical protein